ncbi:MAG: hypothetical protein ACO3EE_04365 [Flavobacteriales bacterium]
MSKKKKNKNKETSTGSLTNSILQLFYKAEGRDLSHKSIASDLRITSKDGKRQVLDTLLSLVQQKLATVP